MMGNRAQKVRGELLFQPLVIIIRYRPLQRNNFKSPILRIAPQLLISRDRLAGLLQLAMMCLITLHRSLAQLLSAFEPCLPQFFSLMSPKI